MKLATIGYEGFEQSDFLNVLRDAGAETLVDVRELPLSRKKGFSKKSLELAVSQAGMQYIHFKALGTPADMRHAYQAGGDWQDFSRGYLEHLDTQGPELDRLAALIKSSYCCLMCFEADPGRCHRSLLVSRLGRVIPEELVVNHLTK